MRPATRQPRRRIDRPPKGTFPLSDETAPSEPPPRPPDGGHWTDEQWRGITTVGHSLLVSAAAGSGKTAMLAARCAYLVCDAPQPCDVDELLVVTFTDAAAGEMRSRVTRALRARAAREPGGRAAQQMRLVDAAQVSTLHSFCSRVLRQHFHLVGLDPGFGVLDGEEAKLLRNEVARELFADRYELDGPGVFQRFVDAYGDGDDERLVRLAIKTHELLCSLVDPAGWIDHARRRLREAASRPLEESELGRELHARIERALNDLSARCARATEVVRRIEGFDKYLGVLGELEQTIRHWDKVFRTSGLSALKDVSDVPAVRLPPVKSGTAGKELAKGAIDSVREEMKAGTWRDLLRFSPDEWLDGLRATVPHADVFLELVEQFGRRYRAAKDASRALDFADLERFTLDVLRDPDLPDALAPSAAARSYHRRFRHVLVDEYQDINEVQDAILTLVSRECVALGMAGREEGAKARSHGGAKGKNAPTAPPPATANLFCVGDVKQSIYRFRLAEAGRFLARQAQFRADGGRRLGDVIDLQKNFRSRAPLLDAINGVFTRLMSGEAVDITYDASHHLHAGAEYPAGDGVCTFAGSPIEMHLLLADVDAGDPAEAEDGEGEGAADRDDPDDGDLDRAEREAVLLAQRIREMMGMDGKPPMCVTERASKHEGEQSDDKGKASGGSPSSFVLPPSSFVSRPLRFRDCVILLRSMKHKADDYAAVLRQHGIPVHSESGSGYFESTEVNDVLALLALLNNGRQDVPLAAVLRSPLGGLPEPQDSLARVRLVYPGGGAGGLAFHEAVSTYAAERDDELAAKLRDVLADLARWRELAQRRPLADVIRGIYEQTGYLAYCAGLVGGEQRVVNLLYLLERARQFGTFHRQGLARFVQFIDGLREESDLGAPAVASEAEDVVRIMSVHRSKGLEFPVVFLPDLGKNINLDDSKGAVLVDRQAGLGLAVVDDAKKVRYPSLASMLVRQRLRQQALAEEMRVLYVAMTRAKEHLVMVGTCSDKSPDRWHAQWAGHAGPLPADMILGARRVLDWLGPVAAACGAANDALEVRTHSADDVARWRTTHEHRPSMTPAQERLARLEPLDPAPPPHADAQDLIARLTSAYPHEQFAHLPAAQAVTDRPRGSGAGGPGADGSVPGGSGAGGSGAGGSEVGGPGAGGSGSSGPVATLPKPRFMLEAGAAMAASEIGEATHLVLEHLDFRRPCDRRDVAAQLAELVQRKLVAPAQAKAVDIESLAWLAGSTAGALLRAHRDALLRELPVYFADSAHPSADPQDQVMCRGRVDVLIPLAGGGILIDYKTDRVPPDAVPRRAESYQAQADGYRRAVEAITGVPVRQVLLVFLAARVVHAM